MRETATDTAEVATTFTDFGLPKAILTAIGALGYERPTAIQREAIPALLAGSDVTGVAQTGTGKTAAYGLPLLAAIDPRQAHVQALVLVPTRELAIQVTDALTSFAAQLPIGIVAIYGGSSIGRQITALKRGAQIVVGTPGRVIDLIERRSLHLDGVTFAVLDEADEMLRMGFAEDVDRILTEVPVERQTALFSATMPREIRTVAAQHLRTPVDVSVAASATPVAAIEQQYVVLPFRDKALATRRLIAASDAEAAVIFVRTRSACDELGSDLIASGIKAAFISGDVSQNERERTVDRLRGGQVDVLVATDVAARGMDVERIGLVINFDAPSDPETYIHRVGRTGRAGRSGRAVTFFTPRETSRLRFIEKRIGRRLEEIDVPTAAQVRDRQAEAALAAAVVRQQAGRLNGYQDALRVAADIAGLDVPELAAALLATVIGDDGNAPVEVERHGRRRDQQGDSRERDGQAGRSRRDRGSHQGRQYSDRPGNRGGHNSDRSRNDRSHGDSRDSRYAGRDDRRAWERDDRRDSRVGDDRRHDAHGHRSGRADVAAERPQTAAGRRTTKPRWDAARRAERAASAGREPRSTGFSGRDAARPAKDRSHGPAARATGYRRTNRSAV